MKTVEYSCGRDICAIEIRILKTGSWKNKGKEMCMQREKICQSSLPPTRLGFVARVRVLDVDKAKQIVCICRGGD
jgi:hypothetical protein